MHFVCSCSALEAAVTAVQYAIAKTQNSIRDCILFECEDDRVILKATDGNTLAIRTQFEAVVSEAGTAALPARTLSEIIRRFPDADVEVKMDGSAVLTLQCLASKVDLGVQNAAEFPVFPEVPAGTPVEMPQEQLRRMIEQVIFSVATADDKAALTGVQFFLAQDRLTLLACDGFRLAVREDTVLSEREGAFIVPARALREAVRTMQDTEEEIQICLDESRVCFRVGATEIFAQLLRGEPFNYRPLLPKSSSIQARTDRKALLETIQRAIIIVSSEQFAMLELTVGGGSICIHGESMIGRIDEAVPAVTQGDDLTIGLNGHYITDVLKAIEDDEITLQFNSSTSPVAVERSGIQAYCYLILPIQGILRANR